MQLWLIAGSVLMLDIACPVYRYRCVSGSAFFYQHGGLTASRSESWAAPRKGLAPDGFAFKLQVFRSSLDFDGSGSGSGAEGLVEAHSWVSWGTPKNASNPCDSPPLACCLLAAVAAMAVAATVATKTKPKPNSRSPAYSRLDIAILQ